MNIVSYNLNKFQSDYKLNNKSLANKLSCTVKQLRQMKKESYMHTDEEIKKMQEDFLDACSKSKLITYDDWKKRPWWQKLIAYIFYLFSPMF